MIRAFGALVRRDLRLGLRRGADSLQPVLFFVLALTLFPFGVGPAPEILARIGVGVIWVLALLAVMLSLDRLYQADAEDGSLELLAPGALPLELVALAKCLAHWLTSGLVLVLVSPLLALLMQLPAKAQGVLALALLLGTPTLTLIGSIGAALLIGARRGSVLLALRGAAALHPGADLRGQRGRGRGHGPFRPAAAPDPGRHAARRARPRPARLRRRAPPGAGVAGAH